MKWINFLAGFFASMNPLLTALGTLAALFLSIFTVRKVRLEIAKMNQEKRGSTKPALPSKMSSIEPSYRASAFFIGREEEMRNLMKLLGDRANYHFPFISGLGGIGKTTLALEAAQQSRAMGFFRNIIRITARNTEMVGDYIRRTEVSPLTLNSFLSEIGNCLGSASIREDDALPEKKLAAKTLLQENPSLLVLDNMETCHDFIEIANSLQYLCGANSKAIVTSRRRHDDIDFAYNIHLSGFVKEQGIEFIRKESSLRNIAAIQTASDSDLSALWQVTGGAPLAMKLVIGQSARLPIANVMEALGSAHGDIYPFIFLESWKILTINSQKLLGAIAAFQKAASSAALWEVSTLSSEEFASALDELVLLSLVEVINDPGASLRWYGIHQLTRHFIKSDLKELWKRQNGS